MANKLLLGSGDWHWGEEWCHIDANADNHPDIVAALPPLPDAVARQRWDTILMVHAIEHIAPWKALELAQQCYACLAPGGVFILEQPNILYAAKVLLGLINPPEDAEPGQYDMWPLYGNPATRDEWMLHRWGWHPDSMIDMLLEAGFERSKIEIKTAEYHVPVRDFRVEARR